MTTGSANANGSTDPHPIAEGSWALTLAMPDHVRPRSSRCYLLVDAHGAIHVVDPGYALDANLAAISNAANHIGGSVSRIRSIIVTHFHGDHLGLAMRLRTATGAPILVHEREAAAIGWLNDTEVMSDQLAVQVRAWGLPEELVDEMRTASVPALAGRHIVVDGVVRDGDTLDIPGRRIRVIHTPGHTTGHICLHDEKQSRIYTGDHILQATYPGIGLGAPSDENPLVEYLSSLDRMAEFEDSEVWPGHGEHFCGLRVRTDEVRRHHSRRTDEVAQLLDGSPDATPWQLAPQLYWSGGWASLRGFALASALRQTAMHIALAHSRSN